MNARMAFRHWDGSISVHFCKYLCPLTNSTREQQSKSYRKPFASRRHGFDYRKKTKKFSSFDDAHVRTSLSLSSIDFYQHINLSDISCTREKSRFAEKNLYWFVRMASSNILFSTWVEMVLKGSLAYSGCASTCWKTERSAIISFLARFIVLRSLWMPTLGFSIFAWK